MEPNHIVIERENYENYREMMDDLAHIISILTRNRQVVVVREEADGLFIIEHDSDDPYLGGPRPRWLTDEEYQDYLDSKNADEEEEN